MHDNIYPFKSNYLCLRGMPDNYLNQMLQTTTEKQKRKKNFVKQRLVFEPTFWIKYSVLFLKVLGTASKGTKPGKNTLNIANAIYCCCSFYGEIESTKNH